MATYGEFIESVEKTEITIAKIFLEWWKKSSTEEEWAEYRQAPLTPKMVLYLAEDAANYLGERIARTDDEELYASRKKDTHAFLKEIHAKAVQLGISVELGRIDTFLTPSETLAGKEE